MDRVLNSIASIYRDVAVLQNNAEDSVGLINLVEPLVDLRTARAINLAAP